jgi:hypothetical protein
MFSNWNVGSARLAGRASVIRQRLGRAKPAKSNAVHKPMSYVERMLLCERLERNAEREWRKGLGAST